MDRRVLFLCAALERRDLPQSRAVYIMKKTSLEIAKDIAYELFGNLLIAFATVNIAAHANFAVSGFSGIALTLNKIFGFSIGLTIFVINIPFALICAKVFGKRFLLRTVRCICIQSLLMDLVMPLLPVLHADRMICALCVGILYGIAYAAIYIRGSSTGGLDFIILLLKHLKPHYQTGKISFALDIVTIMVYGTIFRDFEAVIFGIIIVFVSSTVIDRIILGLNSGVVAYIVTYYGNGRNIADRINRLCDRGSTILEARGGYTGDRKEVVMVTGSAKDIYSIQKHLRQEEPKSFMIVMDSKEVQGEGFAITKIADI